MAAGDTKREQRRTVAALALQGLLAGRGRSFGSSGHEADDYAADAVSLADALLARLAASEPKEPPP